MTKTTLLAALLALSVSTSAFAADETYSSSTKIKQNDNGGYSETDKTTSDDGTGKATAEKKVDVDVKSNGAVDKTVETEKTKKTSMFHKNSVKTKDTSKTAADGTVKNTHKKVVNGTTVEDSSSTSQQ